MTHANRAIHTHAASIMNTHIDAIGGLVSNPSDRETRGSRAHAAPLNLEVGTSSWAEPHVAKRDIGQLSNRKLIDPSAPECRISAYVGKITGRDWDGDSCWTDVGTLKRCMNFYVGIVLGVPLQIGFASCRDGNKGICSSLGHGNLKSNSLFHTNPLHIVSWVDDCSGVEDNGLWGVLMGMKARGKFGPDHAEGFAPSLIEGPIACGHRAYPVYEANSLPRSQSLFCTRTQEGGAESMGGTSGRAGDPSDGGDPLSHSIGETVSGSRSVHSMFTNNDHVYNLPTLTFKSSLSSHALRQALPVWTSMETSHPFIQLSSCLTAFTQGGRAAERVSNVLRSVPVGAPTSYLEQSGMCNYLFAAYTLIPTTILCQWILIAVMRLWFIFNLPRSS